MQKQQQGAGGGGLAVRPRPKKAWGGAALGNLQGSRERVTEGTVAQRAPRYVESPGGEQSRSRPRSTNLTGRK